MQMMMMKKVIQKIQGLNMTKQFFQDLRQLHKEKKKKEGFQKELKSNHHKNKIKSQEVIDISVINSSSFSVNNALDGLSSSTHWLGADIYIGPPDNVNCSNEDSADDDNPHLHNFSRKQLMANCEFQVTGYCYVQIRNK